MVIDPRDTTAQRDQAQAQLGYCAAASGRTAGALESAIPAQRDEAKAQVLKAQADLANAQAEYRRQRGVDPRATTQQSIDSANAQLRSAQAALASAQAQLEVAEQVQLQIRQQETNVEARERRSIRLKRSWKPLTSTSLTPKFAPRSTGLSLSATCSRVRWCRRARRCSRWSHPTSGWWPTLKSLSLSA